MSCALGLALALSLVTAAGSADPQVGLVSKISEHPSYKVRFQALRILGSRLRASDDSVDQSAVDILGRIATLDPHYLVRGLACWLLGDLGDLRGEVSLARAARDDDAFVRARAESAIEAIASRAPVVVDTIVVAVDPSIPAIELADLPGTRAELVTTAPDAPLEVPADPIESNPFDVPGLRPPPPKRIDPALRSPPQTPPPAKKKSLAERFGLPPRSAAKAPPRTPPPAKKKSLAERSGLPPLPAAIEPPPAPPPASNPSPAPPPASDPLPPPPPLPPAKEPPAEQEPPVFTGEQLALVMSVEPTPGTSVSGAQLEELRRMMKAGFSRDAGPRFVVVEGGQREGFRVSGTLSEFERREEAGGRARVRVVVRMVLATWPQNNIRQIFTARAAATSSGADIAVAALERRVIDAAAHRAVQDVLRDLSKMGN